MQAERTDWGWLIDWTQFLDRQVKDLTVGNQIAITALTTLLTYVLVFGINWLIIREGRKKDQISRRAKQIEIAGERIWDAYDQIQIKLTEAQCKVKSVLFHEQTKLHPGGIDQSFKDEYIEICRLMDAAIGHCATIGFIGQLGKQEKPELLETLLTDRYTQIFASESKVDHLKKLNEFIARTKVEIVFARDFELMTISAQHFYAGGQIPKKIADQLRQFDSPLHRAAMHDDQPSDEQKPD